MPTVTLSLRRKTSVTFPSNPDRRYTYSPEPEDVELDDLTPRARALAEAFAQHPHGRPLDVVMEQDARIRDVVPNWETFYPGRGDERPPRKVFRNWSMLRPSERAHDAAESSGGTASELGATKVRWTAVQWLECEARTWPLDWYVVSAVGHDPVPSWEAGAADRYLTPHTALVYLRRAEHRLGNDGGLFQTLACTTGYLPADRIVCGVHQWRPETLDAFIARPVTLWTVSEAAAHLGYTGPSATGTARKQLHRWQLTPQGRAPGRGGESLYDADQIKALHAARKGSGRHGAAREGGKFTTN
ncbi:hypothetical protein [Streptomyces griseus]|uniref:hypothetical protein n=1 Tax=Streptomyces griseus TaxID=1911 RepID=UPI0033A2408D